MEDLMKVIKEANASVKMDQQKLAICSERALTQEEIDEYADFLIDMVADYMPFWGKVNNQCSFQDFILLCMADLQNNFIGVEMLKEDSDTIINIE